MLRWITSLPGLSLCAWGCVQGQPEAIAFGAAFIGFGPLCARLDPVNVDDVAAGFAQPLAIMAERCGALPHLEARSQTKCEQRPRWMDDPAAVGVLTRRYLDGKMDVDEYTAAMDALPFEKVWP